MLLQKPGVKRKNKEHIYTDMLSYLSPEQMSKTMTFKKILKHIHKNSKIFIILDQILQSYSSPTFVSTMKQNKSYSSGTIQQEIYRLGSLPDNINV